MSETLREVWLRDDDDRPGEIWVEPSREAQLLLRYLPWLVSPEHDGPGPARVMRRWIVAPFTQLTLFSFDLQYHLLEVLHRTFLGKASHTVGMTLFVLWLLVLAGFAGPLGVPALAAVLTAWYVGAAVKARLPLWGVLSTLAVGGLGKAALAIGATGLLQPWHVGGLLFVTAFGIAFGHVGEAVQPPRAFGAERWHKWAYGEEVPGGHTPRSPLRYGATTAWVFTSGIVNEAWAAPRLMPYCLLSLMFRVGYAKDRFAVLRDRADRAWAAGDPALDYVGVGGPTYLRRGR